MASTPARPLRALWIGLVLWAGGRAAFVWAEAEAVPVLIAGRLVRERVPMPGAAITARLVLSTPLAISAKVQSQGALAPMRRFVAPDVIRARANPSGNISRYGSSPGSGPGLQGAVAFSAQFEDMPLARASPVSGGGALRRVSLQRPPGSNLSNWSGSLWFAARDGSGTGLASEGQLGRSQPGVRVYRRLTPALAVTGRLSTALAARQSEASVGVAVQRGPFALLAERRIALDRGGRNDWSVTAVAGASDIALPLGLRLDGYVQAGIVGRDVFADGALTMEHTVMEHAASRLSLGAGSWGSIQPGVARLDVGPQIVARAALAGRPVRVSAEWGQRVAGNAAPGSGPVITVGADF